MYCCETEWIGNVGSYPWTIEH